MAFLPIQKPKLIHGFSVNTCMNAGTGESFLAISTNNCSFPFLAVTLDKLLEEHFFVNPFGLRH